VEQLPYAVAISHVDCDGLLFRTRRQYRVLANPVLVVPSVFVDSHSEKRILWAVSRLDFVSFEKLKPAILNTKNNAIAV
jgi:hypothetical protein